MSSLLNKAGKELFRKNIQHYTPPDPLYEYTVDSKGKQRRTKRHLPPGLSDRDAKILQSVQKRAHYLDKGFNLCGLRFGWSFLIALIPLAGSVADALLNYGLVIRKARQAGIPKWLEAQMVFNSAVSVGVSLIPIVGDVVLAVWKANSRNAVLLEEYLRLRGEEWLKEQQAAAELAEREAREREVSGSSSKAATTTTTTALEQEKKKGWTDIFTIARWRGGQKASEEPRVHFAEDPHRDDVQSIEPDHEHDENYTAPASSTGHGSIGSYTKRSISGLLGSLGRKKGQEGDSEHVKAPPAGEKGRFVEHIPEANREVRLS